MTCTGNFTTFGHAVFDTQEQTYILTDILVAKVVTPPRGEVKTSSNTSVHNQVNNVTKSELHCSQSSGKQLCIRTSFSGAVLATSWKTLRVKHAG